jgi:guanylate kinase
MTRTPPPTLSLEERRAALEKAKESRQVRAEMKRGIRLGEVSIFDAINDPRESIRRMKVIDLLSSTPGIATTGTGERVGIG